nr:MAG TPA: nuclease [Caudoviricetes sp.]
MSRKKNAEEFVAQQLAKPTTSGGSERYNQAKQFVANTLDRAAVSKLKSMDDAYAEQLRARSRPSTATQFSAGSTPQVNQRINDYLGQLKSYKDALLLQDEKSQLENENKWLSSKDPLWQQNSTRISKIDTLLKGSQAEKPKRPLLEPKKYANQDVTGTKESSETIKLRTDAAKLLQQSEKERKYWEDAQKRYQPDSRDYADAKARWERFTEQYQALGSQLPGGVPEISATDYSSPLARAKASYAAAEDAFKAAENDYYNVPDGDFDGVEARYLEAEKNLEAAKKQLDDAAKQTKKEATKADSTGEEQNAAEEEKQQKIEEAYLAFTQAQQQLEDAQNNMANSTGEDITQYSAAYNRAKKNYDAAKAAYYNLKNDADASERNGLIAAQEDKVQRYETYRYMDGFQEDAEAGMEKGLVERNDPVSRYLANKTEYDAQAALSGTSISRYNWLADNELKMYYFLLNRYGLGEAKQYLSDLEVTLDKRISDFKNYNTEITYGTSGAIGKAVMNAATVPANIFGGVSSAVADVGSAITGKFNPYSAGHELSDYANTVRGITAQEIVDSIDSPFWGAVAANTYQAVMSGADSALGATLFGNGYTWIMGSSAASQRAQELYEKGASGTQIGLGAIASGLIEAATEKYSIEYFTSQFLEGNVTGFRDWAKKTLIQALNEGSEEVASDIANLITDALLEGKNSDYRNNIQALVEQGGMSREEAQKQAFINQAIDTFWSFYGGAVSGGLMGGTGGIVNATTSDARKIGKDMVDSGSYDEILKNAVELGSKNKDVPKLQSKAEKGNLGKRGSDYAKLTNIYQENIAALTKQDVSNVTEAIAAQAEQLGAEKNPGLIASGIVKKLTGEKLTMSERYAMAQNQEITDTLLNDISRAGSKSGGSNWVRNIGTYTLAPEIFGTRETETEKSAKAAVHDQLSEAAESIFGKEHAFAIEQMYYPGQSRGRYVEEMAKAYKAGQEGIDIADIEGISSLTVGQVDLAYNLGKQSVDGSSFDYDEEAEGQSYLISDSSPVNISEIASAGGGGMVLLTDEGKQVNAKDVKFGSYGTARLFKAIETIGVDAQTGNTILEASKNSQLSNSNFAVAVLDAYNAGRNGVAMNAIGRDSNAMRLDEATRQTAWEAGRDSERAKNRQKQQTIDRGEHAAQKGSLTVKDSAKNIESLNEQQKSGMDAARLLSEMGVNITVYASTEKERNAGMENGSIYLEDGSIWVDLNAGADGQGVMAFALSHEFTHFVEEFSPEKFHRFTEILFEAVGTDVNVNELIAAKAAALKRQGYKELSAEELNDLAYSEVVAEMMETALTDTDVMERISARLQQTDMSLWEKIKKFLQGLVERLKEAYRGLNPDSSIAQLARDTIRSSEEALNAFADAASDAVVNYQLQDGRKNNAPEGTLKSSRNGQKEKTLVALHNLTEEKFLKTLKLGGFPMPSIAITKAGIPHTNFGDITVVFGKETIDPKVSRYNAVYSADAWTPVVPKIEYEADRKATDKVYNRLGELKGKVAEYFQHDLDVVRYDIEDRLNRESGEKGVVDSLLNNYALKAAFLEEQGKHIEQETRQEERIVNAINNETEDKLLNVWNVLGNVKPEVFEHIPLKTLLEEHGAELERAYPGMTKNTVRMSGVLRRLSSYLNGTANTTETYTTVDAETMKKNVDSAIDKDAFAEWVKELFSGVEKSKGVYNGKERYTPSGGRRSFKETHIAATLEGIVKAMRSENGRNTKNVSGFFGVKTLRAATSERFKSIADMHKLEGRLQNLTDEQISNIQDDLGNRLYKLMSTIDEANAKSRWSDNELIRMDSIGEIVSEIGESRGYTPENVQRIFAKYNMEVNSQTAQEVAQLLSDISQMPVNIFEAKPARAVGFDEIKNVIAPDTASQRLLEELSKLGIPYQLYEEGNEAQRQQLINQMDNIRFSRRVSAEEQMERMETEIQYLKKLVQIQKRGNKDYTLDRNSLNQLAARLIREGNANGRTTELAALLEDTYNYISRDADVSWDGIEERAGKAADWLEEHRKEQRDEYAQEVLDWMAKRRVRLSEGQIGEIEYSYGSVKDFQKAIRGSIIIDQNANTILDQFWQEAAAQFADQFDSGLSDMNMPGALAELVQKLKDSRSTSDMEAAYYQNAERKDLIEKIVAMAWDAKPVESVSDKLKEEIAKLKKERNAALQEAAQARRDGKKAVEQALSDYRYQRDAEAKAMKAVYEAEREQIATAHQREMNKLEDSYTEKIAAMSKEIIRLLRKYGEQDNGLEKIKEELSKTEEDAAIWQREFKRLLREYDTSGRNIDRLEKKVQAQQEAAKAKVESARKTEERFKLERVLTDLNRRLLNPTKTLYVPDSLQPAVTMAMQSIATIKQQDAQETASRVIARYGAQLERLGKDPVKNAQAIAETEAKLQNVLERRNATVQNALERLQQAYTDLAEVNKGVFTQEYNDKILEFISDAKEAIGDSFYGKLNIQQLQAVRNAYTAILNTIRNANKLHGENLKQGWAETAKQAMAEFQKQPDKTPALGKLKKTMEKLSWNNEKPYYAFERMGSNVMMQLYENLRNGEDGWYRDFAKARAIMLGCMDKYHFDQWENNLVEVEMADGEKVALDLQERMNLYAASKREQYLKHLTKGGFILTGSKRNGKDYTDYSSHVLALETVIQIRNGQVLGLTAEQIAFANEMQEYLSTVCAEQNNEVSRALYGVSKAKEKDYWPIKSSAIRSERVRDSQESPGNRQKNAGHMKPTDKNASNAVELRGFMETWANHVNDTAMYHNFALPMEDFYRVYNYNTSGDGIRQQMLRKHGEASVDYVDTFLKDVNGGVRADNRETVYNMFLSGFKKAAVSASLSVAIQQPSAVGRAFSIIDAKYFVGSKVDSAGGISATWEEMKKYAPVVGLKEIGRFDTDMGRSTQELLSGENGKSFMAAVDKFGGWMPEQMDKITWVAMWEAAKRQTKAEHPGLNGEALKTEAGKLFTRCITQTQVYDSVFSRSGNMRSKSVYMKMLTSFMAEPTTTINMMGSAVQDIRGKNFKTAGKKISSVAAALILNSLLASLVYAARDDDEEKTYLEKYLSSLASELVDGVNPITYYPGFKDVWSIVQGYDVERNDMSLVSDMYNATQKATDSWKKFLETDPEDEEAKKENLGKFGIASLDAAAGLLNMGGIPLKNVLRELRGVKNTYETVSTPRASDSYTRGKAIWDGIQENIPAIFRGSNGKTERLYHAIVNGSQAEQERLKTTYSTEQKFESAIVTALADQDSRIRQAAKEKAAGNAKEAERILAEIEAEGNFNRKQIQSAFEKQLKKVPGGSKESVKEQYLNGEIDRTAAIKQLNGVLGMRKKDAEEQVTQWNSVRDTGIEYDEIRDSYLNNSLTESKAAQMLVRYGGKSEDAAKKTVREWGCKKDLDVNYSEVKEAFIDGEITEQQLKNALVRYGGKDAEEAEETVNAYRWQKQHPDSDLSSEQVLAYTKELDELGKSIEETGIQPNVFADYRSRRTECTGVDADGDGKTDSGSKKKEILSLINSLPISDSQKDALYYDNGYAASGLKKAPWHKR